MKKLLLLTLITTTFLQAEEGTQTDLKQNVCRISDPIIYREGFKKCKENDILYASTFRTDTFLAICKEGTVQYIKDGFAICTLRAEKDFGKIIKP